MLSGINTEITPIIKNLLIINGLLFLSTISLKNLGIDLIEYLGLHQFQNIKFKPHQLITHMFMHGSIGHLIFNMFTLWIFGRTLEKIWGSKKFLNYYLITGVGAALIYITYVQFQIFSLAGDNKELINIAKKGLVYTGDITSQRVTSLVMSTCIGASGAVYGILLAFGIMFPNSIMYLYFAIPVKTKYVVTGLAIIALISGLSNIPGDNIAHFAHLGGMIFGFIILKYWKKKGDIYF
tara:strand:+ start:1144 stop:1854 length:711 start_codon:yes stop_codon:yes gene_type:complete